MSYKSRASSNRLQNSPYGIVWLIDQLLVILKKAMGGMKRDSEIFLTGLSDVTDCIRAFGDPENKAELEYLTGLIKQLNSLASQLRNCEQARYEQISKQVSLLQRYFEEARTEASLDALTQIADQEYFNCTLLLWIPAHQKIEQPFTIAFLDLDNFRQINEQFDRSTGDKILAFIALELSRNIRERDFLARFGGDEFAVLSSGMELANAAKRFSKLLRQFETTGIECSGDIENPIATFTFSCGIAEYISGESAKDLISRAQNALHDAKRLGKNHVRAHAGTDDAQLLIKFGNIANYPPPPT